MIVVSAVLVAAALVLLIIGLFGSGLGFVYASIGVSIAAGVFLLLGALQRRGEGAQVGEPAFATAPAERLEGVTTVTPTRAATTAAETAVAAASTGGEVVVVRGRPRYHVADCRFLAGRTDTESIGLAEARADGFTACGVCKPDEAVATTAAAAAAPTFVEPTADEKPAAPARRTAKKAPARKAAATATRAAAKPAKAAARTAKAAPAKAAAKKTAAKPAAKKVAAKPAARPAAKKAPAKKAAKPAKKAAGKAR